MVSTEEGQALANDFGIQFFETSAKNDINVEKAFVTIAREVSGLPCFLGHRHPHLTLVTDTPVTSVHRVSRACVCYVYVCLSLQVKNRMLVDGGPRTTGGKTLTDAKKTDTKKCC